MDKKTSVPFDARVFIAKENPIIQELNGLFSGKANRITGRCLGFNQYMQFSHSTKRK